ncbi:MULTISPECIES: chemotaxis response regulator CheY [Hydrogenovibrio]|jgi:two-component system chemotaxis response regulator CheY|uniref:chemotaxis response regulator CheY n=1 Tax=Thiomicrospira sp. S5 TaxID=1803865 RepID=UPI000AEA8046
MQIDRDMNILVVDDFSTMRRIVKNLLKELGFSRFDEADDGATAWPMIQSGKYDFIVSDWNMPEMTGIDLLRHVRADAKLKDTPFLLITAEAKRSQILEAAEAGVDGYIVKPFTAATLNGKIQKIFERVEERKKAAGG